MPESTQSGGDRRPDSPAPILTGPDGETHPYADVIALFRASEAARPVPEPVAEDAERELQPELASDPAPELASDPAPESAPEAGPVPDTERLDKLGDRGTLSNENSFADDPEPAAAPEAAPAANADAEPDTGRLDNLGDRPAPPNENSFADDAEPLPGPGEPTGADPDTQPGTQPETQPETLDPVPGVTSGLAAAAAAQMLQAAATSTAERGPAVKDSPAELARAATLAAAPAVQSARDTQPSRGKRGRRYLLVAAMVAAATVIGGAGIAFVSSPDDEQPQSQPSGSAAPSPTQDAEAALVDDAMTASQPAYSSIMVSLSDAKLEDLDGIAADARTAIEEVSAANTLDLSAAAPDVAHLLTEEVGSLRSIVHLQGMAANLPKRFRTDTTRLRSEAGKVERARAALTSATPDALTNPRPAVDRVVTIGGQQLVRALRTTLIGFLADAKQAKLTADLRSLAGRAQTRLPLADGTVAALEGSQQLRSKARDVRAALAVVASLRTVDADHLAGWDQAETQLRTALGALRIDDAAVDHVHALLARARQTMAGWEKQQAQAEVRPPDGPSAAALDAYAARLRPLFDRYAGAVGAIPDATAAQQPSLAVTTRYYRVLQDLREINVAVINAGPGPAGLGSSHQQFQDLTERARTAASWGHQVAFESENCNGTPSACRYGAMPSWNAYVAARGRIGTLGPVRAAWEQAYARARQQAATPTPPAEADKPVV